MLTWSKDTEGLKFTSKLIYGYKSLESVVTEGNNFENCSEKYPKVETDKYYRHVQENGSRFHR